jgi:hypothetical protein
VKKNEAKLKGKSLEKQQPQKIENKQTSCYFRP